jgi:hypothetical protein
VISVVEIRYVRRSELTLDKLARLFHCIGKGFLDVLVVPQVPLITLTEVLRNKLKADIFGNMVFWVSFCVFGQPMCLVL